MWVRGLKHERFIIKANLLKSHPMWVRGLKRDVFRKQNPDPRSHPMWVRGLKPLKTLCPAVVALVAPYVGAWIETRFNEVPCGCCESHPMWVRGLKPSTPCTIVLGRRSHPMWVRGLKQITLYLYIPPPLVAPYVGAWIETV